MRQSPTHHTHSVARPAWAQARVLIAGLSALAAGVVLPTAALAHPSLVRSSPADSTVLAQAPAEMSLWFSEPISAQFSSAQVLDMQGHVVPLVRSHTEWAEPRILLLDLPDLPPGAYTVAWTTLSEADGHLTRGHVVLGIGQAAPVEAAAAAASAASPPIEAPLRGLDLVALLSLVGALAVAWLVVAPAMRRHAADDDLAAGLQAVHRRVLRWAAYCGVLALVTQLLLLLWQLFGLLSASQTETAAWSVAGRLLTGERWGVLWLARQAVIGVLIGAAVYLAARPPGHILRQGWLLVLLSSGLMLSQALAGHAAAAQEPILAVAADTLHLLAASCWAGGLIALLTCLSARRGQGGPAVSHLLIRVGWAAFGRLAALSVAVLLVTGLYSAGQQVASLDAVLLTVYGNALLVKVVLLLGAGALGLTLTRHLHRRVETYAEVRRRRELVRAEAALVLLAVLAAGLLTASPPARGLEFAPQTPASTALSRTAADLVIALEVKPNRPGPNVLTIRALSSRRPAPGPIERVLVRVSDPRDNSAPSEAVAEPAEVGVYRLGANDLRRAGPWGVNVVVQRAGLPDASASFDWTVAAPEGPRPTLVSDRPLEPLLSGLAGGLSILVVLVAWQLSRRWQAQPGAAGRASPRPGARPTSPTGVLS